MAQAPTSTYTIIAINIFTVIKPLNSFVAPKTPGECAYIQRNADPQTGEHKRNYTHKSKVIVIKNVCEKENYFTLDTVGFQLVHQPTKHKAFLNDAKIQCKYYPENIQLLKSTTGASQVVIFDHRVIDDSPTKCQPVLQAHVDQTTKASITLIHCHLPAILSQGHG
ncbi:hypothetical protein J132_05170 [Termitomyces sp. J132]|nr:hypothetical protein J132_05170 [Termitomyces sp. J132]